MTRGARACLGPRPPSRGPWAPGCCLAGRAQTGGSERPSPRRPWGGGGTGAEEFPSALELCLVCHGHVPTCSVLSHIWHLH